MKVGGCGKPTVFHNPQLHRTVQIAAADEVAILSLRSCARRGDIGHAVDVLPDGTGNRPMGLVPVHSQCPSDSMVTNPGSEDSSPSSTAQSLPA